MPLNDQQQTFLLSLWKEARKENRTRDFWNFVQAKGISVPEAEKAISPVGEMWWPARQGLAAFEGLTRGLTGGAIDVPEVTKGHVAEFDIPYLSTHGLGPIKKEAFQQVSLVRAIPQAFGFTQGPLAAGRAVGKGLFSLLGSQPAMKTAYRLAGQKMPKLTGLLSPLAQEYVQMAAGMMPVDFLTTLIRTGDIEQSKLATAVGLAFNIPGYTLLKNVPKLWRGRVAKALNDPEVQLAAREIKSTLQPDRQADLEAAFGGSPELSAAHPQRQADLEAAFGGPITDRMRDIAERAEQVRAIPEQAFRTQVDDIVAQAGESAAALRRWHQENAARINAGGTTPERAALAQVGTKLRAATEESAAGRRIRQQAAEEAAARPTEPVPEIPEAESPPALPPSTPPQAVPVAPGMVRSAPVAPPRATSGALGSLADELRAGGLVRMDKSVGEWEGLPRSRYSGRSRVGSLTQGRSVDEWAADLMKNRPDLGIRSGDELRQVIMEGGERLYGRPVDFEARALQVEKELAARMGPLMTTEELNAPVLEPAPRVPFSLEAPPVGQVRPRAGGPDVSPEIPGIKPRPKVPTTRLPGGARTEGLGGTELDPEWVRTQQDMAGVRQDQLPLEPSRAVDISRIDQVEVEIREIDDAIREARRVGRAGDEVALTGAREMEAERDALLIKREELRRTPPEGAAPRGGAGPTQSQQRKLFGLLQKAGIRYNTPEYEDFLRTTTGKNRFRDLTYEEAQRAISDANTMAARETAGRAERVISDVNAESNKVSPADRVTLAGPEGEPVKDLSGTLARWFGSSFGRYHISKVPAGKLIVDGAEFSVRHMNLWTRDLATSIRDFNKRTKLGLADKYQIARALDGAVEVSELTARQALGYRRYRQLLNGLATLLGLPEDLRISEYFPHIFHGTMGKRLAALAASEGADPQGAMGVTVRGIRDIEQVPVEKLFPHLLRREGATGYITDLDEVIWTYIRGATRKIWMDRFLATAKQQLEKIPDSVLKVEAARYASAVAGVQDLSRQGFARNLASKEWFDWAVDRLVMKLAPEEARGTLIGTPKDAVTFLESISKLAQKPIPGYPRGEASSVVARMRARVALKADMLRDALQNPNAPPILSNALYRAFVWQRLGANIGWGFINYTEYLTNVLPTLGKHAVRAVSDYANYRLGGLRRIEGIPVHKVLRDVQLDENTFLEMLDPTRSKFGGAVERLITSPGRIPERHIRSIAQIALFRRGIARGLSPKHALATATTELKTIKFGGGKVYMPAALRNPLVHHMLMFTSWGIHQVQFSAGLLEDSVKGLNLIRKSASEGARAEIFARQVAPFLAHAGVYAAAWGAGEALGLDIIGRLGHPLIEFGRELYKGNYNALTDSVTRQMGMPAAEVTLDVMLGVLNSVQGEDTDWNKIVERSLAPAPQRRLMSMDRRNVSPASGKGVLEMLTGIRADDERRRRRRKQRKRRAQR